MPTNEEMLHDIHAHAQYLDLPTSKIADRVIHAKVRRDGGEISLIQEIADSKTLGQQNKAALAEAHKKLDAILAKLNEGA